MKLNSLALVAVATLLMGCGGNSLNNPLIFPAGETLPEGTDPALPTAVSSPVVVPDKLKFNVTSARVVPGTGGGPDTLLVAISALDTTPELAT